ncbi:MAG: KilA-N domain-containing protein [Victivallales bacterium]|nr:KilA-N domain-containing protein [Victivallales bacterium]
MKNTELLVQGINIRYAQVNGMDYVCLTDIAKVRNPTETALVISHWLSTRFTVEFLGVWETIHNPDFNTTEFSSIRNNSGSNGYVLTTKQWMEKTNAIGLISKSGRYGGTYAHKDIAFEFASWVSVEFKLYLITEFERLKEAELKQLGWSVKRELTKLNYHIHTDSIQQHLIPRELSPRQISHIYADEADVLNMAIFGMTAQQWREANPEKTGNLRDYATVSELICLANLESLNAVMIEERLPQGERLLKLNRTAIHQMQILEKDHARQILGDPYSVKPDENLP